MATSRRQWPTRSEHVAWVGLRLLLVLSVLEAAFLWARLLWRRAELDCWVVDGTIVHRAIDLNLAGSAERFNEVASRCSADDLGRSLWWLAALAALIAAVAGMAAWAVASRGYRVLAWRKAGPALAVTAAGAAVGAALVAVVLDGIVLDGPLGTPVDGSRLEQLVVVLAAAVSWPIAVLLVLVVSYAVVGALGWTVHASFGIVERSAADELPEPIPTIDDAGERPRTGISLSGGGVRSASFSFGALQRLNQEPEPVVDGADYLSAVSGGSYAAGAWTVARHANPDVDAWAPGSEEQSHFRTRLNYLRDREGGLGLAVATLTMGLAINVAVLVWMLVLVARPLGWLVGSALVTPRGLASDGQHVLEGRLWWPVLAWLVATAVLVLVWVGLVRVPKWTPSWVRRVVGMLATSASAVSVLLASVMVALPFIVDRVPDFIEDETAWARVVEILGTGGIVAAVVTVLRKPLGSIAPRLGGVLVVLMALAVGAEVAAGGAVRGWDEDATWYLIAAGIFLIFYAVADPDWWSLQPYYRARLRSAYATHRDDGDEVTAWTGSDEPELQTYRGRPGGGETDEGSGPQLIVCAAMNTSGVGVVQRVGVPAFSFTFDPERIQTHWPQAEDGHSQTVGVDTDWYARVFKRWDTPKLSVMTAVGMSGAAVSSAMGRLNMGSTNALLTLANLRLGLWMPNPLYVVAAPPDRRPAALPAYPRRRVGYLLKELFGVYEPADHHVNVTDGGHWENLGLVELLRRRCAEIYCFDGSGAGPGSLATLAEAITLAAQECGVEVAVDFSSLRLGEGERGEPEGFVIDDVAIGRITYRGADGEPDAFGLLYYGKATLARARELAPRLGPRLLAYREKEAKFPHHSTADQLFDTEQFETYRLLGTHVAGRLLAAREAAISLLKVKAYVGRRPPGTAGEWALSDGERNNILAVDAPTARAMLTAIGELPDRGGGSRG